MLAIGAVIGGKYRLVRSLGEGGMGVVWAAKNEIIDRDVAVKVMLPHLARDEEALRRFFNEARICASIRDAGIVDVLDMGTAEDGSPFIVMELLSGESLEALLHRSGALAPSVIVPIMRDVAHTLALAHDKGVVHRDLKPANIYLHAGPKHRVVKILDFGISKVVTDDSRIATRSGAVLGSPAYMSPEQAAGTAVDYRTDIYALGVILYEALAGHVPFADADNTNALLLAIATRDVPPLGELVPSLPPVVNAVVERALHRAKDLRYAGASEMAKALDAAQAWLAASSSTEHAAVSVAAAAQPVSVVAPSRMPLAAAITASAVTSSTTGAVRPAKTRSRIAIPLAASGALLWVGALVLFLFVLSRRSPATAPSASAAPGSSAAATTAASSEAVADTPTAPAATVEVMPSADDTGDRGATATASPPSATPNPSSRSTGRRQRRSPQPNRQPPMGPRADDFK